MQTILGSGGAIGFELAKALRTYTDDIRLVSRHPKAVNPEDQLVSADLTRPDEALKAIKGSKIVYLTVGLPYNSKLWRTTWPVLMRNVIGACKANRSRLVFFDNVYMYDPDCLGGMTETTPVRPVSKKGKVRAEIADLLLNEARKGNVQALIARAADFYGPSIKNSSILTEMVFNNLARGKKAYWMGAVDLPHSFTYTPDAARATALLGNTADAYGGVWHLPTAAEPLTGKEWIERIAEALQVQPKYQVLSRTVLRGIGLFVPLIRELTEMMYQYERDYIFNSDKFERRFDFKPTSCKNGITEIVKADYQNRGQELPVN